MVSGYVRQQTGNNCMAGLLGGKDGGCTWSLVLALPSRPHHAMSRC